MEHPWLGMAGQPFDQMVHHLLKVGKAAASDEAMIHYSEKNRSPLCHIITDFHSLSQKRVARFDLWGVSVSGVLAMLLVGFVRLLVSH